MLSRREQQRATPQQLRVHAHVSRPLPALCGTARLALRHQIAQHQISKTRTLSCSWQVALVLDVGAADDPALDVVGGARGPRAQPRAHLSQLLQGAGVRHGAGGHPLLGHGNLCADLPSRAALWVLSAAQLVHSCSRTRSRTPARSRLPRGDEDTLSGELALEGAEDLKKQENLETIPDTHISPCQAQVRLKTRVPLGTLRALSAPGRHKQGAVRRAPGRAAVRQQGRPGWRSAFMRGRHS